MSNSTAIPEPVRSPRASVFPLRRMDPSALVWIVVAVVLTLLIALPVVRLVIVSFQDGEGAATVANYVRAVTAPRFRTAAWNSFLLASSVGLLSVLVATPMAWATARTDMPGRRLINALVMTSLVTPGFLTAIAWILLAGPNAGVLNRPGARSPARRRGRSTSSA